MLGIVFTAGLPHFYYEVGDKVFVSISALELENLSWNCFAFLVSTGSQGMVVCRSLDAALRQKDRNRYKADLYD